MDAADYKTAREYWIRQAEQSNSIELSDEPMQAGKTSPEDTLALIECYVSQFNTCALATTSEMGVRCTPIEYVYKNKIFYIFSEGGQKFLHLEKNKEVSLAIFDQFKGFKALRGLTVLGTAQVIKPGDSGYDEGAAVKGINVEALRERGITLYLIAVTMKEAHLTWSKLAEEGLSISQHWTSQ